MDDGEEDYADTDDLLDRVRQVIFGGNTPEGDANGPIVKMLQTAATTNPVMALAQAAAAVVQRALSGMQSAPDGGSSFYVLKEVVGDLATVAGQEGIFDYRQEEIDAAMPMAAESLQQMGGGKLFPQAELDSDYEMLQGASQDWKFNKDIAEIAEMAGEPVPAGGM